MALSSPKETSGTFIERFIVADIEALRKKYKHRCGDTEESILLSTFDRPEDDNSSDEMWSVTESELDDESGCESDFCGPTTAEELFDGQVRGEQKQTAFSALEITVKASANSQAQPNNSTSIHLTEPVLYSEMTAPTGICNLTDSVTSPGSMMHDVSSKSCDPAQGLAEAFLRTRDRIAAALMQEANDNLNDGEISRTTQWTRKKTKTRSKKYWTGKGTLVSHIRDLCKEITEEGGQTCKNEDNFQRYRSMSGNNECETLSSCTAFQRSKDTHDEMGSVPLPGKSGKRSRNKKSVRLDVAPKNARNSVRLSDAVNISNEEVKVPVKKTLVSQLSPHVEWEFQQLDGSLSESDRHFVSLPPAPCLPTSLAACSCKRPLSVNMTANCKRRKVSREALFSCLAGSRCDKAFCFHCTLVSQ